MLIAPTAVLPEGYTIPMVALDQIAELLHAHPEHPPTQLQADPAKIITEMTLLQCFHGASRATELEEKLDQVQTQTLVVFGTADRVVPPAMGRIYRERMPNCHYIMIYDAGHMIAAERPEALTITLADFLALREIFIVSRRDGRINP